MQDTSKLLLKKFAAFAKANPDQMGPEGLLLAGVGLLLRDLVPSDPNSYFQDVLNFHRKFKIQYDGPPRALPPDLAAFRHKRLKEEFIEIMEAQKSGDLAGVLDGHIDLVYIALGTCQLHGWDFDRGWQRVHTANMQKELASKKNPGKYGSPHDIVKPAGWTAPDLSDLI